jgi:hypothetical protein
VFALIAGLLVRISIPSSRRPQTANSSPKDSFKKTLGQLDYLGVLTLVGNFMPWDKEEAKGNLLITKSDRFYDLTSVQLGFNRHTGAANYPVYHFVHSLSNR